jgi:hypothetical protein
MVHGAAFNRTLTSTRRAQPAAAIRFPCGEGVLNRTLAPAGLA